MLGRYGVAQRIVFGDRAVQTSDHETKNNRRRWCEMEICGNRAKQRRRAARGREA